MSTLADRLSLALNRSGKSQVALARACDISPASVHGWLSGRTKALKGTSLIKAASFLNVREIWLAEGRGPMDKSADEGTTTAHESAWPFRAISQDRYAALPAYVRGVIEGRVQSLIEEWESSEKEPGLSL